MTTTRSTKKKKRMKKKKCILPSLSTWTDLSDHSLCPPVSQEDLTTTGSAGDAVIHSGTEIEVKPPETCTVSGLQVSWISIIAIPSSSHSSSKEEGSAMLSRHKHTHGHTHTPWHIPYRGCMQLYPSAGCNYSYSYSFNFGFGLPFRLNVFSHFPHDSTACIQRHFPSTHTHVHTPVGDKMAPFWSPTHVNGGCQYK